MGERLRYVLRNILYSRALDGAQSFLKRSARNKKDSNASKAQFWDDALSNKFKTYIAPTVSTQSHAQLIALLAQNFLPHGKSALDFACGGGLLAAALGSIGYERYTGVDISTVALEAASARMKERRDLYPTKCDFHVGALGEYAPDDLTDANKYDLIVFSEVLYYLDTAANARAEVERCTRWLRADGLICVSVKDDGKSRAILRELAKSHEFVASMLFQEQLGTPGFKLRVSRARPAFLACLIRSRH